MMGEQRGARVTEYEHGAPDLLPSGLQAFFVATDFGAMLGIATPFGSIAVNLPLEQVRAIARWTPDDAADWLWSPAYVAATYAAMGIATVGVALREVGYFARARPAEVGVQSKPLLLPDALALGRIAACFLATLEESEVAG